MTQTRAEQRVSHELFVSKINPTKGLRIFAQIHFVLEVQKSFAFQLLGNFYLTKANLVVIQLSSAFI